MKIYDTQQALPRSKIYQLLSGAYFYPDEDFFTIRQQDSFLEELKKWGKFLTKGPTNSFLEKIEEKEEVFRGTSWEDLKTEYVRIFGHSISKECPPYQTEYGSQHLFQQTHTLADLAGFYRAFGLEVSQEQGERLDHIGIELEFMGFLAYKEHYAKEEGHGEEKIQVCRDGQEKFLKEYLGRWAPLFLKLLRKKAVKGFYYELGVVTDTFLEMEMQLFHIHPEPIGELQTHVYDFDSTCAPCINT
jgi:DMSO reductase family type II enzyme chaperone